MRACSLRSGLGSGLLLTTLSFALTLATAGCSGETTGIGTGDAAGGDAPGIPDGRGGDGGVLPKPDADGGGGGGDLGGRDSVRPPDSGPGDTGPRPDGAGGQPFVDFCATNEACESGFCVQGPEGGVCTRTCLADCPDGWGCQGVLNVIPDVVFICVPLALPLCQGCQADAQCGDGTCQELDGGRWCLPRCDDQGGCGPGFRCDQEAPLPRCVPETGSCTCWRPEQAGRQETCAVTNEAGTCLGVAECDPAAGWQGCTARTPAPETCNGEDDDCNGLLDDGVADEPCEVTVAGVGTCTGVARCLGLRGMVCDAPVPAVETCDFRDEDCDGQTDEPFLVDGAYGTDEHCGSCNASCAGVLPNATATCDPTRSPPRCVVAACAPGFTRLNEFQCIPEGAGLCEPCESDETCLFAGGRCLDLGFGRFCARPCGDALPCPQGYACTDVGGGERQCTPVSGSCTCSEATVGQRRDCSTTWSDPADPDAPSVTCFGFEVCQTDGWSGCTLPAEACDSLDNDCDGRIDEGFRDEATGLYLEDANCGRCGNDCAFLTFANAAGVCALIGPVPGCVMHCDEGYVDVDDNPTNGCECEIVAGPDVPDGVDSNCDGVDGDVDAAVFVSKEGDDLATGAIDDPVRSVAAAIALAAAQGKRDVYVATGLYEESVHLVADVHVYGGYGADFRVREPRVYETTLFGGAPDGEADAPGTVNAVDLGAAAATLDGFTVFGLSGFGPGESSVAVYVRDSGAGVRLSDNRIVAGNGTAGARGADGGDGPDGAAGGAGAPPVDVGTATCAGETAGGAGGQQTCGGVPVSGGGGGAAVCPDYDESPDGDPIWSSPFDQTRLPIESGEDGAGPEGGAGGEAGYDALLYADVGSCDVCQAPRAAIGAPFLPHDGADGGAGAAGTDGAAGAGCAAGEGALVAGRWAGVPGTAGGAGSAGSGGGGGGAGGGVETVECARAGNPEVGDHDRGGSGGGGGAGGCAATGGGGGTAGGGSFGVVVVFTAPPDAGLPAVSGNTILTGRGGRGGDGGNGGRGGAPGDGGAGGPADPTNELIWCAGEGGRGGRGGRGGHGGGGGGGCGGVSWGLYVEGAGAVSLAPLADNQVERRGTAGAGGTGGASLGSSGASGAPGAGGARNF
jgi:hypothetical protein